MDPQKCLEEFIEALMFDDAETALERGEALQKWLNDGGFMPVIGLKEFSPLLNNLLIYVETIGLTGEPTAGYTLQHKPL